MAAPQAYAIIGGKMTWILCYTCSICCFCPWKDWLLLQLLVHLELLRIHLSALHLNGFGAVCFNCYILVIVWCGFRLLLEGWLETCKELEHFCGFVRAFQLFFFNFQAAAEILKWINFPSLWFPTYIPTDSLKRSWGARFWCRWCSSATSCRYNLATGYSHFLFEDLVPSWKNSFGLLWHIWFVRLLFVSIWWICMSFWRFFFPFFVSS